ncbi:unnamed protein product [Fusarium graminearum]|nr:unnamed protein product [Fusarium graminearum]VTO87016.1 unnamed protein product [Fusarium graminearum]
MLAACLNGGGPSLSACHDEPASTLPAASVPARARSAVNNIGRLPAWRYSREGEGAQDWRGRPNSTSPGYRKRKASRLQQLNIVGGRL